MRYRISDTAKEELAGAVAYYEHQRAGLGFEFAVEVGLALGHVLDAPDSWPHIAAGFRRYKIDRFPYALIYRKAEAGLVEVVSIFDQRRRPESWRRNLK